MEDTGWSRTKKWNGHQLKLNGDGSAFLNGDYFGINFNSMKQFINYLETSKGERETYFNMKRKK